MHMFLRVIIFLLFLLAPLLSCSANDSVLVMPFVDLAQSPGVADKVTDVFARELVRTGGHEVYHPQVVRKYLSGRKDLPGNPRSVEEAIRIAKTFGARYVISGIITEYDAFPPFSLDISVEMFDAESKEKVSADSISRASPSLWQRFVPVAKRQTMEAYVNAVCAQLITRSFKKKVKIK